MKLLLDTNVLSEVTRPQPAPSVLEWLDALDEDQTFISVISLAEIRRGIALLDKAGDGMHWPNSSQRICHNVSIAG